MKTDRYLTLFVAIVFQCLLLAFAAKGVNLVMAGNLVGILLILLISIPGSTIIWFNYYKKSRPASEIRIDAANSRMEIKDLPIFQMPILRKHNRKSYCFPFQDIHTIQLLRASGGRYTVQIKIKGKDDSVKLCSLPILQARHLARHISGLIDCGIQIPQGEEPLSPLPPDAVWDPDAERKKLEGLPHAYPGPAIIFFLLAITAAVFRYFDQRPPVWFYLGIHFQVVLSVAGLVFLLSGREILANAWYRLKYIILFLFSLFLLLSMYLTSRGLFPLLFGCIALLIPAAIILKSSSATAGRSMSIQKRLLVILSGIIIAVPFCGYGYFASKAVYGFFAQSRDDISGIAFYEIKPPRHVQQMPAATARRTDKIRDIMEMLQESVSQKDSRRVERNYLMQIKHLDGTSFFATIGRIRHSQGCILFSEKYGLWGWEYGGYDNVRMIQVLKRHSGLWEHD